MNELQHLQESLKNSEALVMKMHSQLGELKTEIVKLHVKLLNANEDAAAIRRSLR